MLTQKDYSAIRKIFKEEVKEELKPIGKDIAGLKTDVSVLKTDVSALKVDVTSLKQIVSQHTKDIKAVRKDVSHIKKDQKIIINCFDREYLDLKKRAKRIEGHLGLETNTY